MKAPLGEIPVAGGGGIACLSFSISTVSGGGANVPSPAGVDLVS